MIIIKQIKINAKQVHENNLIDLLKNRITQIFRINISDILYLKIVKESLDARKKPDIFYIYNCIINVPIKVQNRLLKLRKNGNITVDLYAEINYEFPQNKVDDCKRPLIVGSGPAGLFAAYFLARSGYRPVLIERGSSINERKAKVQEFFKTGKLDIYTNIQYGEGGAGTFSDGKLNTGTKDKAGIHQLVLETFVDNGAKQSILYENKPHIGTDVLEKIVVSMRNEIINCGGSVFFDTMLSDIGIKDGRVISATLNNSEEIFCDNIVLAIGHSARDTFRLINNKNIQMCPKAFAVGVRVVHEQSFINTSQYGDEYEYLPAADYKIAVHTKDSRSVYSFCMCPGGFVVPAASGINQSVVNGMSYSTRDGKYANSAMLINVDTDDFESDDLFAGMNFQEKLEKIAYESGHGYTPVQSGKAFFNNSCEQDDELMEIASDSVLGPVRNVNVRSLLPKHLGDSLCEGIYLADDKIKGFSSNIKLVAGLETRTSSPVKILRNKNYESNISGIFPCGEGAGYAGGIMSAAVDGIKVATAVANKINGDQSNE